MFAAGSPSNKFFKPNKLTGQKTTDLNGERAGTIFRIIITITLYLPAITYTSDRKHSRQPVEPVEVIAPDILSNNKDCGAHDVQSSEISRLQL